MPRMVQPGWCASWRKVASREGVIEISMRMSLLITSISPRKYRVLLCELPTPRWQLEDYHRYMVSNVPNKEPQKASKNPQLSDEKNEPATNRYTHGHEQAVLANHAQRRAVDCAAYLLPHLRPGMSVILNK